MPSDARPSARATPLTEAQRVAAELLDQHTSHASGPWLEHITSNGLRLWDHTYAGLAPNDLDRDTIALARLSQYVDGLPDSDEHRLLKLCCVLEGTRHDLVTHAHWVDSCCPIIMVGHKAAAAMICTSVPETFELRAPWPAIVIEVPDRLIEIVDPTTDRPFWIRYCLVRRVLFRGEARWSMIATGDGTLQQAGCRMVPTRVFLANSERLEYADDRELNALEHRLDTQTKRAITCLTRLAANMLIVATEPRFMHGDQPSMRQLGKPRAAVRGNPDHRRFVVHAPSDLDLREHVRHYCRTGRRLPSVASHVPGHWRRVACGPNHSERRIQWIGPHFRCADADRVVTKTRRVGT